MSPTTVVLGWDGLDAELMSRWGLDSAFGESYENIDTIENEALKTPHTSELWPSILTGRHPSEHGIRAASPSGQLDWESTSLNAAGALATTLPTRLRDWLGKQLRMAGAGVDAKTPEYYRRNDLPTVFDSRLSMPVSIPNYQTEMDRRLGLSADRADLWKTTLAGKETEGYELAVSAHEIDRQLAQRAGQRLAQVEPGLARDVDLVFVWLGYLDSVGHIAPTIESRGWQRRHYEQAANWTHRIRGQLDADDTLLCVSDHGLRAGEHTHDAVLAGPQSAVSGTRSILDVRGVIDAVTPGGQQARPVPDDETTAPGRKVSNTSVEKQLRKLGYIDE